MRELTQVVCAINFSEPAARVVRYAAAFVHWYEADLTVLHVAAAIDREMSGFGPTPMGSGRVLAGPTHRITCAGS